MHIDLCNFNDKFWNAITYHNFYLHGLSQSVWFADLFVWDPSRPAAVPLDEVWFCLIPHCSKINFSAW